MDLTIENAIETAESHIERLNRETSPRTVPAGEAEDFQPVGSSEETI